MLCRRETIGWLTVAMLFAGPLALPGATPERQGSQAIAQREVGPTRVEWLPKAGDYERLILTVAGPGDFYVQRDFGPSEAPSFSSFDARGGSLPDGVYAYELRAVPRPDLKFIERPWVQSGHLWIQEGSFVDKLPALLDPSRRRGSVLKTPLPNVTPKDIVQADDLIVQGQACIGSGCVDGDADIPALKLKEIFDTKIVFENDGCCHPSTRDWALQANDVINGTGDFLIRDLTAGTTPFRIGSPVPDNAFTILHNGNIGLGTLTPAVRLDVKGSASGAATERLQNSSATGYSGTEYLNNAGTVGLFFGVDNANSNTRFNSVNNFPIVVLTNSTERMRVTSAGSVGIGTSTPSSKFHVNGGDIRVSGGSFIDDGVTLNAPDYVFEPSYKLMPLSELRKFVTQEKHLPNVPNAKEVKEQGLNLSQFQMRLLEKVEELTLYTLTQDERLTGQQEELLRLREQNALLHERLAALEKAVPAEKPE